MLLVANECFYHFEMINEISYLLWKTAHNGIVLMVVLKELFVVTTIKDTPYQPVIKIADVVLMVLFAFTTGYEELPFEMLSYIQLFVVD